MKDFYGAHPDSLIKILKLPSKVGKMSTSILGQPLRSKWRSSLPSEEVACQKGAQKTTKSKKNKDTVFFFIFKSVVLPISITDIPVFIFSDLVNGLILLMNSNFSQPINIVSSSLVSVCSLIAQYFGLERRARKLNGFNLSKLLITPQNLCYGFISLSRLI